MTIKTLLFFLFLLVCLVWVLGFLYYPSEVAEFGLRWTAVVLIAALAFIVGRQILGWWHLRRAKAAVRPTPLAKPVPVVHEDEAALAALIAEASTTLAKAPAYAEKRERPLSGMPLYLLIGPESSGKTSTFINSGLEPQLLAGQVTGAAPIVPTRLCNLWLAKNAMFAEISGRAFSGDLGRWTELLTVLRGIPSRPLWHRLWSEPEPGFVLRGVIGFFDAKGLIGASNLQLLERRSRDWQERLRAISRVFGVDIPVYQVFSKCDALPFFPDFFRRLPEPETDQVLGCTLPLGELGRSNENGVSVEDVTKRLTRSFRPLYHELAKRRITHLVYEPDPVRRPAVYEFPRELKRIRSPLVQFLSDVFRPHPLQPGPILRGYYMTGVREVEKAPANLGDSRADWSMPKMGMEATQLFGAAEASRIFRSERVSLDTGAHGGLTLQWIFASDLFHNVILADRSTQKAPPVDSRLELYRRSALAVVCGVCVLLCVVFLWSWAGNRALGREVGRAEANVQKPGDMLAELRYLDALRDQIVRLRHGASWSLHWGLYSGDRLLTDARALYFQHFQQVLLNSLNGASVARLLTLPTIPGASDPYDPIYNALKVHRMISSGECKAEPAFASRVLRETLSEAGLVPGSEERTLADQQIEFYANELPYGNPCQLKEDTAARDRARSYLRQVKGVDRIYRSILANAEKTLTKPQRLGDRAPTYVQVLNGPGEVSAAFTREGWDFVEKASKKTDLASLGEPCVIGNSFVRELTQGAEIAQAIQRLFIREYISRWRAFVTGFSVLPYKNAADAARKLEILASHNSPLLGLFSMTADQTNFPAGSAQQGFKEEVKKGISKLPGLGNMIANGKKAEKMAETVTGTGAGASELSSPSDITRSFQPVHWVVPPGSPTWITDKNKAYIDALDQLRHSMEEIARPGNSSDPALNQAANTSSGKALDAARQIEEGFKSIGVGGLDAGVQQLLEQPIRLAQRFIITDTDKATAGKVNGELHTLCARLNSVIRKYPFQPSMEDVSLDDLASAFAPASGAIWKFQAQSLADFTVKDGTQWKLKDPAKKPQITQEMLNFLNRAQAITDAFYPPGATQLQLAYTLRPKLESSWKDWTLELEVGGQLYSWTSGLQKQFIWPAPPTAKDLGAKAQIRKDTFVVPVASRGGLWGIFRIMSDAEPRPLSSKLVEWKYLRGGDGRREPIQPAPVRLEIVEFPGGVDLFNPKFFEGFQCPSKAVQ